MKNSLILHSNLQWLIIKEEKETRKEKQETRKKENILAKSFKKKSQIKKNEHSSKWDKVTVYQPT